MANDNELLIKINADAKNASKAFDDVRSQTEDLEKTLGGVAKISAVGFAALTASVGFSLKAFAEAEEAARTLNTALQAQGIYTDELAAKYKNFATEVMNKTGIDDDAITSAQATAQSYLGQIEITGQLTQAIADLATAKKIDLNSAAALVAKTIGTGTNALAREGLQIDDNATKTERYAKTLQFLEGRYKGQAEAANQGLGGVKGLATAFGNLQEEIGARFAPMAEKAIKVITNLFKTISENKTLVDITVALTGAGLAISALGIAIPAVVSGLGVLRAAMAAFGVTTNLALGGIPLAIAAITTGAVLLIQNFDKVSLAVKTVFAGMTTFLGEFAKGFFKFVTGDFQAGIDQMRNASKEALKAQLGEQSKYFQEQTALANKSAQVQDERLKKAAAARAKLENAEQARKVALMKEEQALVKMQLEKASAAEIDLQRQKIETLKEIQKTQNSELRALLQEKYDEINRSENAQFALEAQRKIENAELEKEARDETNTAELEDLTIFQEQKRAQIEAELLTDQEAKQKALNDELTNRIAAQNKLKQEQIKYGIAFAAINQVINSDEVQGAKKATADLIQLTQSKNATLKAIGKAAAIANTVIKTAESAMNIYAGFSTIPIIGPALGIAGAAAAVAFGAEQVGNITAAQSGALVQGTGVGDTVPFMLEPGELVAPKKNFEEVIQGVKMVRNLEQGGGVGGNVEVMIGFDGREASKILTARQNEDSKLGLSTRA